MSFCVKCGVKHSRRRGPSNPYPASYCAKCHAAYTREHRKPYHELTEEQRGKVRARALATVSLKRGKLQRQPCEKCGRWAEKHHDDYSKPLEVRWLCKDHHHAEHRGGRLFPSAPPRARSGGHRCEGCRVNARLSGYRFCRGCLKQHRARIIEPVD